MKPIYFNNRTDIRSNPVFESFIAEKIDVIDALKNKIRKIQEIKTDNLDPKSFKRIFRDITGIQSKDGELHIFFGRGVPLLLQDPQGNVRNTSISDKLLNFLMDLQQSGGLEFRSSPFVVVLNNDSLIASYILSWDQSVSISDQQISTSNITGGGIIVRNPHDEGGINCWGGWGGAIRFALDSGKIEEGILLIAQRMSQVNVGDWGAHPEKLKEILRIYYKNKKLDVNPVTMARLLIKNGILDISDVALGFGKGMSGNLIFLNGIETDVPYDIFKDLMQRIKNEGE